MIEFDERVNAAEKLLGEVVSIAKKPAVSYLVPQAGMLLSFLQKARLGMLVPEKEEEVFGKISGLPNFSRFSTDMPQESCIVFYPMFLNDASIDQIYEYYTKAVTYASYAPASNSIVVNMDSQETLRMLACAFLHELGHAQAASCEGRILKKQTRSDQDRLYEEVAVWTIEYNLMLALGGAEYLATATEFVRTIIDWWQGTRQDVQWEGKGIALDYCVGTPTSSAVKQQRDAAFLLYGQLMAADIFFPEGKKIAAKIEILKGSDNYGYREKEALIKAFLG